MGIFDTDWGSYFGNSPALKMAKEGWNASMPGKAVNAMAAPVVSGVTYPKDLWDEKEPPPIPSQNPDLSRAADVASLMPLGGAIANVAGGIPKGAIGTFAGPHAANAPIKNYMAGAKMERKGASPIDIWQEKGVFRDPEKNWAHEIPNTGHDFFPEVKLTGREKMDKAATYFNAPELYKAYPKLGNVMTHLKPGGQEGGAFGTLWDKPNAPRTLDNGPFIRLEGPPKTFRTSMIHELNHATDLAEGRFNMRDPRYKGTNPNVSPGEYLSQPNERMARAAENRRDFTPDQLKETHPMMTPEEPWVQKIIDQYEMKQGLLKPREKVWM